MDKDEVLTYPALSLSELSQEISDSYIGEQSLALKKHLSYITRLSRNAVAVAAPQIGENIRAFYVSWNGFEEMIFNPYLQMTPNQQVITLDEGCLSLPGWFFKVRRLAEVQLSWVNENGEQRSAVSHDPFMARIFQHEIDHLDGILIPYYMSDQGFDKWERYYLAGGNPKNFRSGVITAHTL